MSKLNAVVQFIAGRRRQTQPLTWSRLQKLLYLADWKSVLENGRPVTPIEWRLTGFGPDAGPPEDLIAVLQGPPDGADAGALAQEDIDALEFVLAADERLSWDRLDDLVNSTFPIINHSAGLNLTDYALIYRSLFPPDQRRSVAVGQVLDDRGSFKVSA